ncbi:electron transfer flavoprotein-ubiquinone oxidoreductase [Neisseria gonorrhoeae]|uniref:Electron transfer flavoprotein-ubiquinone oxidoreductase n=1 Tax=Neisseria gonorrhoeae TaxID=485 RepID=A0A378VVX6_NEIGO|nr:electron transfer flavoprotein-ubiquinone oxidoreductase [Neisseria gonorrhoeae]
MESFDSGKEAGNYQKLFEQSWLYQELYAARNVRPSFKWGVYLGSLYTGIDQMIFRGKAPWTLKHHGKDNEQLKKAAVCKPIDYPKPDGVLTFDRLSSVFLANLAHEENQPDHLVLNNPQTMIDVNYKEYASPETRYCPAGVYEIIEENGSPRLQINAANCVHCKTCDIKDPTQTSLGFAPKAQADRITAGCKPHSAVTPGQE